MIARIVNKTLKIRRPDTDKRSFEDIERHYTIEKELADRLRKASKDDRRKLYTSLYDEICERVPNIPMWNEPLPPEVVKRAVANKVRFLNRFVDPQSVYLEVGPGDCSVAIAIADHVRKVYAVDVSTLITGRKDLPTNFELIISDGTSINVPENSVDVVYSCQLMEHLHPDDALEQLQNIARALKPDGIYICVTPSRLSGPHDVSKYFDDEPTGFHLKEYSTTELARIFKDAGFGKVRPYVWLREKLVVYPLFFVIVLEAILACLPRSLRHHICNRFPVSHLLGRVVARMPKSPGR